MAVLFVTSAVFASAQQAKYTDYYVTEEVGQESASMYWIRIDWNNKFFFIDGDGDDKYTITLTIEGYTTTFKCTTKKPVGSGGGGKIQAMKDKIGEGINKGLDAMKKKQEENKAKKEAKKEAKAE